MPNDYDRIFKEEYLPLIAKKFAGLDYANTVELKDKIQITPTMEREADDFRFVLGENGEIIHGFQIELHVADEDLRPRTQLHHAMFYFKHIIPLRQVIIYVGSKKKPTKLTQNELKLMNGNYFSFEVYLLNKVPVDEFLKSNQPAEVLLAVLADFGKEQKEVVVRKILQKLLNLTGNTLEFEKYKRQLHVLSKLRKLQPIIQKELEDMPKQLFSIKDDLYYQKGHSNGIQEGVVLGNEKGIEKGIEIGKEKGIEIGKEKGIEIGKEKGIEIGVEMTRDLDIARMLKKGFAPEVVSDVLEVDFERVLRIQKTILDKI
jgi:hypothetical protein